MVIRVDRSHLESLRRHLEAQGFPAIPIGGDHLDVLFPASPTLFATAAELDEWSARTGAPSVVHLCDGAAAGPLRRA
jgi:hypothetical protein